ncbi:MAG: hypothetical protein WB930_06040 [Syntrophobacteraceae bacterium]
MTAMPWMLTFVGGTAANFVNALGRWTAGTMLYTRRWWIVGYSPLSAALLPVTARQ